MLLKCFYGLFLIMLCSCNTNTSKTRQANSPKDSSETLALEHHIDSVRTNNQEVEDKTPSSDLVSPNIMLEPVPRVVPNGEIIDINILSMCTEFDYYPLSTTEVKVFITNHLEIKDFSTGESYSLVYNNKGSWEPLPTNPIVNDVGWVFPEKESTHEQKIKLYTDKIPNRPGKYRIYKVFTNSKVSYAEFEMLSINGIMKLSQKINEYFDRHRNEENVLIQNLSTWGVRDDTIDMGWKLNNNHMRELFKKHILNYSAVSINNGKETEPAIFNKPMYSDTLNITMRTAKAVYPVGTKLVTVELVNKADKRLSMGTDYYVIHKKENRWVFLNGNTLWNMLEIMVSNEKPYTFSANLYPMLNDIKPGIYRVIKDVERGDSLGTWTMAAEFRIE